MKKILPTILLLTPVIISTLLIAAHCLRAGNIYLLASCLLMLVLLLLRHPISARFMQLFLVIAGLEWARTTWLLVSARQEMDQPWFRMVLILGSVVVFNFASGLLFFTKTLKERYFLLKALEIKGKGQDSINE